MTIVSAIVVWLAPLALGSGLWTALAGWPRRVHGFATALGAGWILGSLLCGLLMRWLAAAALPAGFVRVGACAVIAGLAGWACAWTSRARAAGAPVPSERMSNGERALTALLLAMLAWRASLLVGDVMLHPVLPWDAWAVWAAKAKAWVLAGHAVPYVPFDDWLAQAAADTRTGAAWNYPELLPWTLTWFAAGADWIEPWINAAWLGLWAGLLLAHYGQWRGFGLSRMHAIGGVYLLGSLPLLDAHVALGGYADVWVAAVMSLAGHAWLRWRATNERGQLAIVVGAIVLLPMLKLEGAIWSIVLGAALVFGLLPRRMHSKRFLIGAVVAILALASCITLSVPWVAVARRYLQDSIVIDAAQIVQSLQAIANALWGQWNWNLLWFALPATLAWTYGRWSRSATTRRLLVLVVVPVLLIVGLFALTSAARYAQSYSAVNRLLLQLTPLLVSLLALVLWLPVDDQRAAGASAADDAAA